MKRFCSDFGKTNISNNQSQVIYKEAEGIIYWSAIIIIEI